jgi:pilus assembly protein CpaE
MNVETPVTVAHAARDMADLEDFKSSVVAHPSGAFVLGAPSRVGEWLRVTPGQLEGLIRTAAALYDYVILDTPGAFNDAVATAMELADNVLIVTSLELSSVKNTSLLLEVLDSEGLDESRSLVVANCTSPETGLGIIDLVTSLKRDSIWKVPFDPAVRKGSQVGQPVVVKNANSPASLSIRALASRIETAPHAIDRREKVRDERATAGGSFRDRLKAALARVGLNAA